MTVFYPHTPKTKSDRLPFLVLVFLILSCIVGATFFFNSNINWNINKWCISTSAYNEAFDNGVNCGIDGLMFFVKRGQKEIDINEVRNKAQEFRKKKTKNE